MFASYNHPEKSRGKYTHSPHTPKKKRKHKKFKNTQLFVLKRHETSPKL